MQTDAENRVSLVNQINGALANLRDAEARVSSARNALAEVMNAHATEGKRYAEMQAQFTRLLDDTSQSACAVRTQLILSINESVENLAALKKAENAAKSEEGTARTSYEKQDKTLGELRTLIKKSLPEAPKSPGWAEPVSND